MENLTITELAVIYNALNNEMKKLEQQNRGELLEQLDRIKILDIESVMRKVDKAIDESI